MSIKITDYINVKEQVLRLDCNKPTTIGFLPRNFENTNLKEELVHESSVATLRILWREVGIEESKIEKEGDKFPYVSEKYANWIGPIIFVSATTLSQNPTIVSIGIGVIANYLTDWFRGFHGTRSIKLDVVVEKTEGKEYKRIQYEGDVSGLVEIDKIVKRVFHDEQ